MVEVPEIVKDSMNSKTLADETPANREPNSVDIKRPPSRRKTGSKFKEEEIKPEKPAMKSGWMGIG